MRQWVEIRAKSAINRVKGMGFTYSLNPYRGCQHGCVYCYARITHTYFNLSPAEDFSQIILIKVNFPELLARELANPRFRPAKAALGTATDVYQPIEARYRLTRESLKVLVRHPHLESLDLVTKGTLILRDLDVLSDLARLIPLTVCISIPTVDRNVWRIAEPGTPPPQSRLKVLKQLVAAGIRSGILMAPLLPGITDDLRHLSETVQQAKDHGACFVYANLVYLKPGVKEYYWKFLNSYYPGLISAYEELYSAGPYPPASLQKTTEHRVELLARQVGVKDGRRKRIEPPERPRQATLGL